MNDGPKEFSLPNFMDTSRLRPDRIRSPRKEGNLKGKLTKAVLLTMLGVGLIKGVPYAVNTLSHPSAPSHVAAEALSQIPEQQPVLDSASKFKKETKIDFTSGAYSDTQGTIGVKDTRADNYKPYSSESSSLAKENGISYEHQKETLQIIEDRFKNAFGEDLSKVDKFGDDNKVIHLVFTTKDKNNEDKYKLNGDIWEDGEYFFNSDIPFVNSNPNSKKATIAYADNYIAGQIAYTDRFDDTLDKIKATFKHTPEGGDVRWIRDALRGELGGYDYGYYDHDGEVKEYQKSLVKQIVYEAKNR